MEGQWHGKLRGRQVLRDPGWTCVLFVKTGGANQDIFIRVMFDTIREQSVVLHSVAVKLGLRASGGPMWLTHPGEDPRYSSCVYEVPVLDWKGRRDWIKARGVSYATPSEQRDMPEGAVEAFPVWSDGQSGGGTRGHDHRQGQPRVDASFGAGGTVRAVHPDVDELEFALHPQRQRGCGMETVAARGGRGTSCEPDGGPIGGVYGAA